MRIRSKRLGVEYYNGNYDELFVNGVYDDGSWNDRGKFGRGVKLYWNKCSGKWVRKKMECYKSEKIWFYEFENFNERSIVKDFVNKSNKNEYNSFKYIDRVGYFISVLYKRTLLDRRLKEDDVLKVNRRSLYISKSDIIVYLGSDWNYLIDRLNELDIIEGKVVGKNEYDVNKNIVSWKLNIQKLGRIENRKFIENRVLEKGILKMFVLDGLRLDEIDNVSKIKLEISDKRLDEICEIKFKRKLDECERELKWGRMFFNEEQLNDRRRFIENNDKIGYSKIIRRRYRVYKDLFDEMNNGFIDYSLFKKDDFGYRFYNVVNGMDKEFRTELKYEGDELVEIDMSGMYVKCLVYMFERIKFLNSKIYKKNIKDGFKRLKKEGWLELSDKEKKINKSKNGFEWLYDELMFYEFGYSGFNNNLNKSIWNDRKWNWSKKYNVDIKKYSLGNSVGSSLVKKVKSEKSEDEFIDFFDEYNRVIREFDDEREYDEYLENFGINGNVFDFIKSDNLIENVVNEFNEVLYNDVFNDKLNSWFVERESEVEKFGLQIISNRDREFLKYKSYDDYLNDGKPKLMRYKENVWGKKFKEVIEDDFFKFGFKKGEVIKYKVLDKKFKIKYDFDEDFRNEINGKLYRKYFIEWESELNKYLIEEYGVIKKIKLKDDIEIDLSIEDRIGYDGFIEKYKNSVLSNYKVDFYNYVKFMVDYGKKEKDEENIYDRNFYKVLIMRILFTQNYIIEGLKMNEVDDIVNEIFGKEGKYFIEKIKDMFFKYDEFGKRKSYNNNEYLERYKNVSKILSVIEVDVMNYLIKRVFNGICNREFYVNIFDGFLIKKKNYEVLKCELNMILRNEVGYMFYMK